MRGLRLFPTVIIVFCAACVGAQESKLIGVWEPGNEAQFASTGYLRITPSHVYFSTDRRNWKCETEYTVASTGVGDTYPGQWVPDRPQRGTTQWLYWDLQLGKSDCTQRSRFVFALPDFSKEGDFLAFVEYRGSSKAGEGHFHRSSLIEITDPLTIPGETSEERRRFFGELRGDDPNLREFFDLAFSSDDSDLRAAGAFHLRGDLAENIPILLRLIATDPAKTVRLSAALNLSCHFTCNGADYRSEDVLALERELSLVQTTISDPVGGRYILEMLDAVWCDMTENARASVVPVLASDLPYGEDTVSINELAKDLLARQADVPCVPAE